MSTTQRRSPEDSIIPRGRDSFPEDLTGVSLGDFQITKLLGRGGMGEVYLATQVSLDRPVALKVLRSELASNPTYLARLRSEATAVARLNHPNIVHVYMLDCIDNIHFIAMEYVQGTNLRDYLIKKGALELPLAYSVMKQTTQAIGAAGEIGLIHRDVKPENILLTKKGRVKVADFGLCRDAESESVHITQTGVTMGTPLYMSPEQAQGHAVDHRSDLYSLGVTFYHMLAGVAPFHADTVLALALKQVREKPRSMLVHRPDLPVEIDRVVLKLMAKDPADRYQSAAELLVEIVRLKELLHIAATGPVLDAGLASPGSRGELEIPETAEHKSEAKSVPERVSGWEATEHASAAAFSAGALSRLSKRLLVAVGAACLLIGAIAGWSARSPEVMSVASDSSVSMPGLWLEPGWTAVPKQFTADDQLHYALFRAPREEWVAACAAVPGFFPNSSHEAVSKAYTQLARILFRQCDLDALVALESELSHWPAAKRHDQELVDVMRIGIKLRKADFEGVVEGFKVLTRDEVPDMYDPALVEFGLEICAEAATAAARGGAESILKETLHGLQTHLIKQLYKIEVPRANRALSKAALKRSQE
jgi:eukaryotic-like serine/threonine-protein kinase